ncbi:hypothetical protein C5D04_10155 [Rathayibacter sp. AY1D2]|uniref:hypothetical protein n=1 Tax=unclassified Rathayibacter TaxID=2609250 RepID=UPI000CE73606|nr:MULTISPECIES: hypothetical protein [unclassified Rathayibacter]PPG79291.1 hypothetical protein C5C52_12700 [Rathayibacter sp. AY1E5]PPH18439.1 hypothetical protein C5C99_13605 [Rathayibacter sp. AY1C4]PPH27150.1 hypothetical protein C5C37_14490 [Rathayibacter sp. AY1F9]PPH43720.1 hypothetical protein C5D09_14495 [Rathayibacter sp. AY1C9]PPH65132.1 hypothetical protein C5D25_04755 [Rathayibacter sp. AY1D7]
MTLPRHAASFRERIAPEALVLLEELNLYYPPRFREGIPFTGTANRRRQDAVFVDRMHDPQLDLHPDTADRAANSSAGYRGDRRPAWLIDAIVASSYDPERRERVWADVRNMRAYTDDFGPVLRDEQRRQIDATYRKQHRIDDLAWTPVRLLALSSAAVILTVLAWTVFSTFTIFPPHPYAVRILTLFAVAVFVIAAPVYFYLAGRRRDYRKWYYSSDSRYETSTDDEDEHDGSSAAA